MPICSQARTEASSLYELRWCHLEDAFLSVRHTDLSYALQSSLCRGLLLMPGPENAIPTSPCLGLKCSQFYCTVRSVPTFLSLASKPPLAITLKLGTLQAVLCTPLMCHPLCGFNDIWYWLPTLCAQPGFLWILIQLLDDLLWHLLYTIQLITPLFPHSNKW